MTTSSTAIVTATFLDSVGRFVANVGVPAAIAFFILAQITPRLDQLITLSTAESTQLTVLAATCRSPQLASIDQVDGGYLSAYVRNRNQGRT